MKRKINLSYYIKEVVELEGKNSEDIAKKLEKYLKNRNTEHVSIHYMQDDRGEVVDPNLIMKHMSSKYW